MQFKLDVCLDIRSGALGRRDASTSCALPDSESTPFRYISVSDQKVMHYTGAAIPSEANEAGWEDTVRADPGMVTRVIANSKAALAVMSDTSNTRTRK
ncbi:hypothetical protein ELE36_05955 [Pseudolysobacter antarcticus]|uniref:Uncharacterized protein n=1 Tax=Pseudolysobacter antarcticus TaxID=2511995 RepID=A0A411HHI7_9GAMM|nr:hypothetical protein [Pseudolysobacter antarcticus]QBB69941.1 hypothetical protein ELE36_05955 [Pseudolysobacter antarcticus]